MCVLVCVCVCKSQMSSAWFSLGSSLLVMIWCPLELLSPERSPRLDTQYRTFMSPSTRAQQQLEIHVPKCGGLNMLGPGVALFGGVVLLEEVLLKACHIPV